MQNVNELLKCKFCQQNFKGVPIILSCCGETICSIHLDEINSNNKRKLFNCPCCETEHDMENKKFVTNKAVEQLTNSKFNFGDVYEKAEKECKKLNKTIEKLNHLKTDPKNFVFEYISKLKNQVDLRKEKLKEEIEELSDQMIKKLEDFEKECYENLVKQKLAEKNDALLKKAQKNIGQWYEDSKLMSLTESQRKEIICNAKKIDIELQNVKQNLEKNLLMNKIIIAKHEIDNVSEKFSNELISYQRKFKIGASLKGSRILNQLEDHFYESRSYPESGFNWNIYAEIKDSKFGLYLNCTARNDAHFPVYIHAILSVVNQNDPRETISETFDCCFRESDIYGFPEMIDVTEFLDINNGFYDSTADYVKVRAEFYLSR